MACSGCRSGTTNKHGRVPNGATVADKLRFHTDTNGPTPAERPELGPCHLWLGSPSRDGYGSVSYDHPVTGRPTSGLAHNLAWREAYGPLPDGYQADHLCYNRMCVRLSHLEIITQRENIRRAWARRRRLGLVGSPKKARTTKAPAVPLEMEMAA